MFVGVSVFVGVFVGVVVLVGVLVGVGQNKAQQNTQHIQGVRRGDQTVWHAPCAGRLFEVGYRFFVARVWIVFSWEFYFSTWAV